MKNESSKETKATALKYDGKSTPKVVAKGTGQLAEKIISIAKEHDVHIHNDPILLEVLSRLELGDEIPEQLYLAVAKIIAFAYFLQGKHPNNQFDHEQPNEGSKNITTHITTNSKDNDNDNENENNSFG